MAKRTETTQRRAHAMRRTCEGGGGWSRERKPSQHSHTDNIRIASAMRRAAEGR